MTEQPNYTSIKSQFSNHVIDASVAQIMQAASWYSEAQSIARQFATDFSEPLEVTASVIAAFSPRTTWAQNVLNAHRFLLGENVPTLGNNIRMAESATRLGFDALRGRKTNSFARNIAGDMSRVTVDVWMIRAAGYNRADANKSMYDLISSVIVDLSVEAGVTPAQMQALIWIVVRGSHV